MLTTERLKLIPLTADDLKLCIENKSKMEKKLGLTISGKQLNEMMKGIYQIKINYIKRDRENYLYYTYWQIVPKDKNCIAGEIGFKDIPNSFGEIEVGYGLDEEYRGNGYMTEALIRLTKWAFSQKGISTIIAVTANNNIPSHRVLTRAGFKVQGYDYKFIYWRIENFNKSVL
ncbi:GNAT family N-acetyltransferase [Proteiniborus sp.]|uniref:GNAT family N-acetyltransferase n=1 Tax=Proteiniborus sp. TaxID=2079015 RepID=UPI00332CFBEB